MVPVTTAVLGAEEIGRLALLTAFGNVAVALTTVSSNYIWAAHLYGLDEQEKPAFVTTLLAGGAILTAGVMVLTLAGGLMLREHVSYFAGISGAEIALVVGMAGALAYWNQIHPLLILECQARWIAVISITGTIVGAAATTLGLFTWQMGIKAVLLGSLLAALVYAAGGFLGALPNVRLTWSRRWCRELVHISLLRTPQSLFEPLATMAERWMVTNWVSLAALGLYSHSQSYRTALSSALGALTKSLMPVSLREAREGSPEFPQTRKGVRFAVFMLTLAGLGFAFLGKELVGLITHGKFAEAAPFVSCWLIQITLTFTVREDLAILQTADCKGFLTGVSLLTQLANLVAMLLLIPVWGVWGVFAAVMLEITLVRLLYRWKASRVHPVQFADGPVIVSLLCSLAGLGIQLLFWENLATRAALLGLVLVCYLVIERACVAWIFQLGQRNLTAIFRRRPGALARRAGSA
jgi:O-antigen/teichoic acid export membrane protein